MALLIGATTLLSVAPLWLPASYSWLQNGTSESAAQGVDGAWVARSGFILFGLAVLWLCQRAAAVWRWPGTTCHVAFGVGMLGVAAFAHKPWVEGTPYVASEDLLHSIFASVVGVGFIAGVIAVAVARRPESWRDAALDIVVLAVALVVPTLMDSGVWGILQRVMFLAAASWYARETRSLRPDAS